MNFTGRSFTNYLATSVCTFALLAGHSAYASSQKVSTATAPSKGASSDTIQVAAAETAPAARNEASAGSVEEVVVTGSRIVREGYESPTPLSVISTESISNAAAPNIMALLGQIPAMTGNATTSTNQQGFAATNVGLNSVNLRSLGTNRVLVLLDGQRVVGSHVTGVTDISSLPQGLISRVDVVTGGASAVYGSDAIAGVVNFILNKEFTGVKGELSAGMTNYSDAQNYKAILTAGLGFLDNRGHVLLSGEHVHDNGVQNNNRAWNATGFGVMNNPAYTTTNGLPRLISGYNIAEADATYGGLILAGPLKGIAFGDAGIPYNFNYGATALPYMQGGDWLSTNDHKSDLLPSQTRDNYFTRVSYDIADNFNVYGQFSYARTHGVSVPIPVFQPGGLGNTIKVDNAYLPASIRTRMVALGLTSFTLGTFNGDLARNILDTDRQLNIYSFGGNGKFDAFGSDWSWNFAFTDSTARAVTKGPNNISTSRFREALDAVVNPATGLIVCRSTLTNPTNGCHPWNNLGTNVNTTNVAGLTYISSESDQWASIYQRVYSVSVTGEPFSILPAGPVSIALSVEHREDSVRATVDAVSLAFDHPYGSASPLSGAQDVTEGAFETLIPLAKGESWADSWDITGAVRYTSYSLAGSVATWKLGTTFSPVPDIKFRATRSRDIRAPNIFELFGVANQTFGTVLDPVTNTSPNVRFLTSGNSNLKPEKADTLGIGAVLQPRALENFSASIDYWDVNVNSAIANIANGDIVAQCANGAQPQLCAQVTRVNGILTQINNTPVNLARQNARGVDIESSYRFGLDSFSSSFNGSMTLHGNATIYLRNLVDNKVAPATNRVGVATGTNPPNWKFTASATYTLDLITATLTGRAISHNVLDTQYIECTSACPTATALNPTINNNQISGVFYLDASVTYAFTVGEKATAQVFLSGQNLLNRDPPNTPAALYAPTANAAMFDVLGTVYRAGIRFKM